MAKARKPRKTPDLDKSSEGKSPKVFVSWSGDRSRGVAGALREWLPDVFQNIAIWMSEHDIEAGTRWSSELNNRLEECAFGILCMTPENTGSPWLLFEAGCLAKSVSSSRVIPYRFDLSPTDILFPLAQFQNVGADQEGTRMLLHAINKAARQPMNNDRLNRVFEKWWPDLNSRLEEIKRLPRPKPAHGFQGTPINPCYNSDMLRLDIKFKAADVINPMTVVIVVGDGIVSELLDRPVAGVLRDEISRRSGGDPFKRAIIIGHYRWTKETSLHVNPTIAIGGETANSLSGEILKARKALGKDKWEEGPGGWAAFVPAVPALPASGGSPAVSPVGARVALWGGKAAETRSAVEHYILRTEGLQHFLIDHAGWS
jgi:hypothetical protein